MTHYIIIVLSIFCLTPAYAQQKQPDPKLSAEEQTIVEKSVLLNPAKISDAKVGDVKEDPVEVQAGPTVWKPAVQADEIRKTEQIVQDHNQSSGKSVSGLVRMQSEAPFPGKMLNFRDMNGAKTQPEAKKASIKDNRSLNGPTAQPEGKSPWR